MGFFAMGLKSAFEISLKVSNKLRKQSFDFDLDSWYSKQNKWLSITQPFFIPDSFVATLLLVVPATSAFLICHRTLPVAHQFWAGPSGSEEWYLIICKLGKVMIPMMEKLLHHDLGCSKCFFKHNFKNFTWGAGFFPSTVRQNPNTCYGTPPGSLLPKPDAQNSRQMNLRLIGVPICWYCSWDLKRIPHQSKTKVSLPFIKLTPGSNNRNLM